MLQASTRGQTADFVVLDECHSFLDTSRCYLNMPKQYGKSAKLDASIAAAISYTSAVSAPAYAPHRASPHNSSKGSDMAISHGSATYMQFIPTAEPSSVMRDKAIDRSECRRQRDDEELYNDGFRDGVKAEAARARAANPPVDHEAIKAQVAKETRRRVLQEARFMTTLHWDMAVLNNDETTASRLRVLITDLDSKIAQVNA